MQCREFQEISEAYLSDELLVETNIQVFRHLENCVGCRKEFGAKRALRRILRSAVERTDEFQMDPAFAKRLTVELEKVGLQKKSNGWKAFFAPRLLIPVMASFLLFAVVAVGVFNWRTRPAEISSAQGSVASMLEQISFLAAGNHRDCALEKLQGWEQHSKEDFAEKAVYLETVAKPLQQNSAETIEMLHAHDCIFEGKQFKHVVLRKGTHIISVFFDKTDKFPNGDESTTASIMSETEKGFQVASFQEGSRAVFVVSDLTESENVAYARILSDSFAAQKSI